MNPLGKIPSLRYLGTIALSLTAARDSNNNNSNNSDNNMVMHELLLGGRGRIEVLSSVGVTKSNNLGRLRETIERANISKLLFLRHGQTAPLPTTANGDGDGDGGGDAVDFDRVLTEEGRFQAKLSGEIFGKKFQPYFRLALVSPAPRTMETAEIFLAATAATTSSSPHNDGSSSEDLHYDNLLLIDSLYDGTMQPKGCQMFEKIGYAPLQDYLNNENESVRDDARLVLGDYAENAVLSIIQAVEDAVDGNRKKSRKQQQQQDSVADDDEQSSTLLLVAHAIYLPAAALGVASLLGCGDTNRIGRQSSSSTSIETILSSNTKEAEGYLIDTEQRSVQYLSRDD